MSAHTVCHPPPKPSGSGYSSPFQSDFQTQVEKNRALLERLLDVTLFLASRNTAFRGDNSDFGNTHNGMFLGMIEFLSRYDAILREHVDKIKEYKMKGTRLPAHYLSPESQNEFINLCRQNVINTTLEERMTAIYFFSYL